MGSTSLAMAREPGHGVCGGLVDRHKVEIGVTGSLHDDLIDGRASGQPKLRFSNSNLLYPPIM
jgi:hypothetical protein